MKYPIYLILFIFIFISCESDDDRTTNLTPVSIEFTFSDGSAIPLGGCISDQEQYAIQIETIDQTNGNATIQRTTIEFTYNGAFYSMSFSEPGVQRVPVELIDGDNVCQLLSNGTSTTMRFVKQDDFMQVE